MKVTRFLAICAAIGCANFGTLLFGVPSAIADGSSLPKVTTASLTKFTKINIPFSTKGIGTVDSGLFTLGSVCGSKPISFILDTGDTYSSISDTVVRDLGLDIQPYTLPDGRIVHNPDGTPAHYTKIPNITLGNHRFVLENHIFVVVPNDAMLKESEAQVALGSDFFSMFAVIYNPVESRLVLISPNTLDEAQLSKEGFTDTCIAPLLQGPDGHWMVQALLGDGKHEKLFSFNLDTGLSCLLVKGSEIGELVLSNDGSHTMSSQHGDATPSFLTSIPQVVLGTLTLRNVPAIIIHDELETSNPINDFGFLKTFGKDYRVMIDYRGKKVFFSPTSQILTRKK
jgi:predicted aspartyl protease